MQKSGRTSTLLFLVLAICAILILQNGATNPSASASSDQALFKEATVLWERTYGGADDDRAFCLASSKRGFVVAGSSASLEIGKTAGWVLQLDYDGNMLWNRTFIEKAESEFRYVLSLDDGFLLVGNIFLPSGSVDGYAAEIDSLGNLKWNVTLDNGKTDKLFSASKAQDGFVLVGLSDSFSDNSDVWVVKINGSGAIVWNKTYGWTMEDAGRAVISTEDNSFVVAGYTNSIGNGDYDFLLLKIDDSGNLLWTKTYGGAQSDKAYALAKTANECLIVGDTRSKGEGESDAWIIKADLNGDLIWETTVGGKGFDMPTCVACSKDGGYLIGGFTFSFGKGMRDFWLFKIDEGGRLLWSSTVGRSAYEEAYGVLDVAENEYAMAGWTNSIGKGHYDFYIVKIRIENQNGLLPVYQLIFSALATAILALSLLFLLIKRRVNRKISGSDGYSGLKQSNHSL
ncbi:MAG: hypothetical protein QXJ40_05910 [Candidatus Bathyarchaeia archaeon]